MPVDNKPVAYALFAHCFTCTKNLSAVKNISRALTNNSIAVLRFDFTGLGESEGDFADTNFSSNIEDLIAASKFLEKEYQAPQILIGHSLGGAAALRASLKLNKLKAVVVIGAPFDPVHINNLLQNDLKTIKEKGNAMVSIGGRPFEIKKQFLDDILNSQSGNRISELNKALLILHSPQDNIVSIDNAAKIYKAANHPKSFVTLDGADHLLSNKNLQLEYFDFNDPISVFNIFTKYKIDEFYNLGCMSHVRVSFDLPEEAINTVTIGTLRILESIRRLSPTTKLYSASSHIWLGVPSSPKVIQRAWRAPGCGFCPCGMTHSWNRSAPECH